MAAATAVTVTQGRRQFSGMFTELFLVSATLNAGNLIDAAGETDTVAVPGVALGDIVLGAACFGVDLAGITVTGYVSAANVVSLRIQNESGATVDLASATIKFFVGRPAW